jgi:hypothetical protein
VPLQTWISISLASLNDEENIIFSSVKRLLQLVPFKRVMAASSVPWLILLLFLNEAEFMNVQFRQGFWA